MQRKTEKNAATRPVSFTIFNSSEKKISEYSIGIAIDILLAIVVTPTPESWVDFPIMKKKRTKRTPIRIANGIHDDV